MFIEVLAVVAAVALVAFIIADLLGRTSSLEIRSAVQEGQQATALRLAVERAIESNRTIDDDASRRLLATVELPDWPQLNQYTRTLEQLLRLRRVACQVSTHWHLVANPESVEYVSNVIANSAEAIWFADSAIDSIQRAINRVAMFGGGAHRRWPQSAGLTELLDSQAQDFALLERAATLTLESLQQLVLRGGQPDVLPEGELRALGKSIRVLAGITEKVGSV
ncbi:MAG: hypothetical protein AB7U97_26450 [Pirellulales bacterium]